MKDFSLDKHGNHKSGSDDDDDDHASSTGKPTPSPSVSKQKLQSHSRSGSQVSSTASPGLANGYHHHQQQHRRSHSKKSSISSVSDQSYHHSTLIKQESNGSTPQITPANAVSQQTTAIYQQQQPYPQPYAQHQPGIHPSHQMIIYPHPNIHDPSRQIYSYAPRGAVPGQIPGTYQQHQQGQQVPAGLQSSPPTHYAQQTHVAGVPMYPPHLGATVYSREMDHQQYNTNNSSNTPNNNNNNNNNTNAVNQTASNDNQSSLSGNSISIPSQHQATSSSSMMGVSNEQSYFAKPNTTPSPVITGKTPVLMSSMRPKLKVQIPLGQSQEGQITSASNRSLTDDLQDQNRGPSESQGPQANVVGGVNEVGVGSNSAMQQENQGAGVTVGPGSTTQVTNPANSNQTFVIPTSSMSSNANPTSTLMTTASNPVNGSIIGNAAANSNGAPGPNSWGVHLPPPSPSTALNLGSTLGPGNPLNRFPLMSNNGEQTPLSAALPSRLVNDLLPSPSNFYSNDWGFSMPYNVSSGNSSNINGITSMGNNNNITSNPSNSGTSSIPTSNGVSSASTSLSSSLSNSSSSSLANNNGNLNPNSNNNGNNGNNYSISSVPGPGLSSAIALNTPGGLFSFHSQRNHLNLDMLPSPLQFNTPVLPTSAQSLSDARSEQKSPNVGPVNQSGVGVGVPSSLSISNSVESPSSNDNNVGNDNGDADGTSTTGQKRRSVDNSGVPNKRAKT